MVRTMCGIAGYFGASSRPLLESMTDALAHRGPDGGGYVVTEAASMGMRRLKIIDLVDGDQPMHTADGRIHLVYNGEVYNFRELRTELEALGRQFHTHSDSEVVLEAYAQWGTDAFRRFNGMWGLAFLDERGATPKLVLSRDHFGIKPLYYGRWAGRTVFASEIKSILADPSFPRRANERVMFDYLAHGLFDHTAMTFFEGIESVPAASFVEIDHTGIRTQRFWTGTLAEDGPTDPAAFRVLFERAVARRLISDVPVGTCLSGGLDSSSITVILAEQLKAANPDARSLGARLQTFSAIFPDDSIDESEYIDSVIGVTHAESHRIAPTHAGLIKELAQLVWQVEMPMVSSAPYAMWTVMRMAKDHVTVLIDGQGGDELLGGYDVYPYVYLRQLLRQRQLRRLLVEAFRWRNVVVPLM
jgi:asparagine synthase (glutamine-hydrolysing)